MYQFKHPLCRTLHTISPWLSTFFMVLVLACAALADSTAVLTYPVKQYVTAAAVFLLQLSLPVPGRPEREP